MRDEADGGGSRAAVREAQGAAEAEAAAAAGGGAEADEEADEEAALAAEGWRAEGHKWVGKRVLRYFDGDKPSAGVIVRWLPADGDDEALWHMVHEDGDEEDLDEKEVKEALRNEAEARAPKAKPPKAKKPRAVAYDDDSDDDEEMPLSRKRQRARRERPRASTPPLPTPPAAAAADADAASSSSSSSAAAGGGAPLSAMLTTLRCPRPQALRSLQLRRSTIKPLLREVGAGRLPRAELPSATGLIVKLRTRGSLDTCCARCSTPSRAR